MIRHLLLALALAAGVSSAAQAQTQQVITGCGSASPAVGAGAPAFAGPGGSHCVDTTVQSAAVFRGGTVTTANVSQQLMPANPNRRGWNFQNQTGGVCYWKIGAAATQTYISFRVPDGAYFETPTTHTSTAAININCATAGGGFYSTEW